MAPFLFRINYLIHWLWLHRRNIGLDRVIKQAGTDLFHSRLHFSGNFMLQVMIRSISDIAQVVATWESTILGELNEFEDSGSDELHCAGEHTRCRLGQGQVLISVHADHIRISLGCRYDSAVTGNVTTTEDCIRTLIHHGVSGRLSP